MPLLSRTPKFLRPVLEPLLVLATGLASALLVAVFLVAYVIWCIFLLTGLVIVTVLDEGSLMLKRRRIKARRMPP